MRSSSVKFTAPLAVNQVSFGLSRKDESTVMNLYFVSRRLLLDSVVGAHEARGIVPTLGSGYTERGFRVEGGDLAPRQQQSC